MGMVRVDDSTHERAKQLSEKYDRPIGELLRAALDEWEENEFFRRLNAEFEALTPEERAEDAAEMAPWDNALADGLDDEPFQSDPAAGAA